MGEEVIGMEPTVEYVLHWVMKPVLATILKMLDTDQEAALNEDLAHGVNEQVPGDTSAMMTETVTENVTGPVTDAVVDEVQKFISRAARSHCVRGEACAASYCSSHTHPRLKHHGGSHAAKALARGANAGGAVPVHHADASADAVHNARCGAFH